VVTIIFIMAITKQKKVEIVNYLRQIFDEKAVLLLTTKNTKQSINAETNYTYRLEMYNSKIEVQIAKNTLINLVLKEKGIDLEPIKGQTYVQTMKGGDEVQAIKVVLKALKSNFSDNFEILGSIVDGKYMDESQTRQLSETPSFNESMSMIAGALNSLTAKIAIGVKEVPTGLARGVLAVSQNSKPN
jgi:large subunit ribosomal protein L10